MEVVDCMNSSSLKKETTRGGLFKRVKVGADPRFVKKLAFALSKALPPCSLVPFALAYNDI